MFFCTAQIQLSHFLCSLILLKKVILFELRIIKVFKFVEQIHEPIKKFMTGIQKSSTHSITKQES